MPHHQLSASHEIRQDNIIELQHCIAVDMVKVTPGTWKTDQYPVIAQLVERRTVVVKSRYP